jgi:hypothetical protein
MWSVGSAFEGRQFLLEKLLDLLGIGGNERRLNKAVVVRRS